MWVSGCDRRRLLAGRGAKHLGVSFNDMARMWEYYGALPPDLHCGWGVMGLRCGRVCWCLYAEMTAGCGNMVSTGHVVGGDCRSVTQAGGAA